MEETAGLYGWGNWGGSDSTALAAWKAHVGEPRDPNLAKKSPINSVKTIRAPILIIYGTGDGVVPNAQSQKMVNALKSAGKSVDVSVLPGEDHWLSRNETRIQVLQQLDAFLRAHL
jgi:dipeptidyl aminopeptidase/acylaminoacyl peptidase